MATDARRRTRAPTPTRSPSIEARSRMVLSVPAAAYTLTGFRAWAMSEAFPEVGRISYLGGELYIDMSPEELESHTRVKGEVTAALITLARETQAGVVFPDGSLLTNEAADLSTEPDVTFVAWEALESGRDRLTPREDEQGQYMELVGTPDLVVEVVSKHSVNKDTKKLRDRYHRAGIPEYWLIDARGEAIDFQLLRHGPRGYTAARPRGGWLVSPVLGRRVKLTRRRGRMNLWQYTLQIREP
jgi:Uma2 family endonuclease